ncbi:MAG: peptidoglycan editing factor PgeF [Patescibacteria group bacterium]
MSTRNNGNLWISDKGLGIIEIFLNKQGIRLNQFITMEQCHGNNVGIVKNRADGIKIKKVDGMVTGLSEIFIGVNTADCVPVFFYNPQKGLIGVVHAGWKGTLENISGKTMQILNNLGSDPKEIFAAIGPHIGGCCYIVNSARAANFKNTFPNHQVAFQDRGSWHIDLGLANRLQLLESGILESHIDTPITCTSCQNNLYFSFRKDAKDSYGEMLGVIGMRKDLGRDEIWI